MGLFWDLIQQSQISRAQEATGNLEQRVGQLERDLHDTREILHKLVVLLERQSGRDLDADGRIAE